MKKNNNNNNMNIKEIMAIFVAYMQQQIEYTGMKIKAMKEWEREVSGIETVLIPEDAEPTYGKEFSKEWL
jgi:hypothetical protein|tara:strand:- start:1796 stop:2005 length:210 start_codon:yes stop_codon:yes gene_type:complete